MEGDVQGSTGGSGAAERSAIRLAGLTDPQRARYVALLASAGVDHEPGGDEVRVLAEHRGVAQRLLLLATSDQPPAVAPPDLVVGGPGGPGDGPLGAGLPGRIRDSVERPASLARRVAGAFVNGTLYLLLFSMVTFVALIATSGSGDDGTGSTLSIVLTVVPLVLSAVFCALAGGTPGMLLFAMRIVDGAGDRPGWARSFARALVIWGPFLVLGSLAELLGDDSRFFAALEYVAPLWLCVIVVSMIVGPDARGWQDRAAGLLVRAAAVPTSMRRSSSR